MNELKKASFRFDISQKAIFLWCGVVANTAERVKTWSPPKAC